MLKCRRKCCGVSCQRLPFLLAVIILMMMNTWLWCNVFSLDCFPYQPLSALHKLQITSTVSHEYTNDKASKGRGKASDDGDHVSRLLHTLVERKKSLFDNSKSLVPEISLSSLNVPTLSPSDKEELQVKILKMSKLKKEYEMDEMMKQIEKNEHNLKRVNISISLSRENNANFEKKAAASKTLLDDLVKKASEMEYTDDDSKIILKIQKLLDDLDKIEDRMEKYRKLLEKQKGLIIRKSALNHNLTFFESVIHN